MKTLLFAALLTLATSASALSISTPVLDVQACPSVMNGFVSWLRTVWGNPWVVTN